MILSETLGLWLSSIVRGGIGWCRRLACFKHGPDRYDCYFPSNRASQESDGHLSLLETLFVHVWRCRSSIDKPEVLRFPARPLTDCVQLQRQSKSNEGFAEESSFV